MVSGGIHEAHAEANGHVEVGVVLVERLRPNGHVKVASGVVFERPSTYRRVIKARGSVLKRTKAHAGIVNTGGDRVQRVSSHSGV